MLWKCCFLYFFFFFQNFQSIQSSYISSCIYQQVLLNSESTDNTNKDKFSSSLVMLTTQLFQMDCLPVGEFVLNHVLEKVDNNNDRVDVVKAAYHVKCGKVLYDYVLVFSLINWNS